MSKIKLLDVLHDFYNCTECENCNDCSAFKEIPDYDGNFCDLLRNNNSYILEKIEEAMNK